MASERTLSVIKPDAVERGLIGAIADRCEKGGLQPVAIRRERLSEAVAGGFYAVHRERPFYRDLVASMTSRPVVVMVLEGENAIARNREIMGATEQHAYAWRRWQDCDTPRGWLLLHGVSSGDTSPAEG